MLLLVVVMVDLADDDDGRLAPFATPPPSNDAKGRSHSDNR
jgi:hypothetical protein